MMPQANPAGWPGASRRPQIVMEIIIESALLYSISALVFISLLSSFTGPTATYYLYADPFFVYMAVESPLSSLPILIS
jgi:hypothetical protein